MQPSNNILCELLEISQLVAGIDRKNDLFEVPGAYFETFADNLMDRIKSEFVSPVKHELESLSTLLSQADKKNVFKVPENYFEAFPDSLLIRLKAAQTVDASEELTILSPLLSSIDKKTPYSTPPDFFNALPDNLVSSMKAVEFVNDELENGSPVLRSLRNKETYTVPDGYFDDLPDSILSKIEETERPAKIIPLKNAKPWLKFAVAAAAAGVILTFGLMKFNKQHPVPVEDPATGLSKISDQEIFNYMQNQDIPLAQSAGNSTASIDFSDGDINDLLGDIPDNELQQYATDQGDLKDAGTN